MLDPEKEIHIIPERMRRRNLRVPESDDPAQEIPVKPVPQPKNRH